MTCEQVRQNAPGLASLASDDEDRRAAYQHARDCRACAHALAEGERVLALLDALPPPPPPAPEVLARVAAEIRADLRPSPWPRVFAALAALVVLAAFATLMWKYQRRPVATSAWFQALVVVGLGAIGAGLSILHRKAWIPLAILAVSIGFALLRGRGDGIGAEECTMLELWAAGATLAPAGILVGLGRGQGAVTMASLAAAGALAGQAALDLLCIGSTWLPHLLVFHAGGVVAAALGGFALAQLPPWRSSRVPARRGRSA
jgi:hypothetical protein